MHTPFLFVSFAPLREQALGTPTVLTTNRQKVTNSTFN